MLTQRDSVRVSFWKRLYYGESGIRLQEAFVNLLHHF
jgi:hypothetical protein